MVFCDIGNTRVHIKAGSTIHTFGVANFDPSLYAQERVYYICVEPTLTLRLEPLTNWINVAPMITLEGAYETLGVDRKLAAWYLHDGIVVDAGSAITIDCMQSGCYQGGFIALGFDKSQKAYSALSSKLDYSINFGLSLATMPKNTQDAISYGIVVPLVSHINALAQGRRVVITGGDAPKLLPWIQNAHHLPDFLFDAMEALMQQEKGTLC